MEQRHAQIPIEIKIQLKDWALEPWMLHDTRILDFSKEITPPPDATQKSFKQRTMTLIWVVVAS